MKPANKPFDSNVKNQFFPSNVQLLQAVLADDSMGCFRLYQPRSTTKLPGPQFIGSSGPDLEEVFSDVNGNESLIFLVLNLRWRFEDMEKVYLNVPVIPAVLIIFVGIYFHQISWDHGQGLKYLPVTFRYIKTIGFCSLAPKKPKVVLNFAKSSFAFNLGWIAGTIIPRLVLLTQAITKELFLLVIQDGGVFRSCVCLIPKEPHSSLFGKRNQLNLLLKGRVDNN